jgi:hypothetical protein
MGKPSTPTRAAAPHFATVDDPREETAAAQG